MSQAERTADTRDYPHLTTLRGSRYWLNGQRRRGLPIVGREVWHAARVLKAWPGPDRAGALLGPQPAGGKRV
jgi:hypothetical protein